MRGFDVEVIGTDADVDRRLSAVAEIDVPFYRGLQIGVPSVPAIVDAHRRRPLRPRARLQPRPRRPRRLAAGAGARSTGGRQLPHRARRLRRPADRPGAGRGAGGDWRSAASTAPATSSSRRARPATSVSVSSASTQQLIRRWDRGVDIRRFDPKLRTPGLLSVDVNVLYAGRLTKEKGVDLLADAFLAARERDPRLHLVLAGGGPEEEQLRDASGRPGDVPGLALRRGSGARLRERRRVPVRKPHRHVRPGRARGAGQRLPVVAVDEGGPATADRARRDRPARAPASRRDRRRAAVDRVRRAAPASA